MSKKGKRDGPARTEWSDLEWSDLIDSFTHANLRQWRDTYRAAHNYRKLLYFDLEAQRSIHRHDLYESLNATAVPFAFDSWVRIVNYRYTLHPLSSVGSLKTIGGRFNFGMQIDPELVKPFPALYIADSELAARAEYFLTTVLRDGLTPEDLALAKPESFCVVMLRGNLTRVFDLRTVSNLREFLRITKRFTMSPRVRKTARRAGIDEHIIKDEQVLYDSLMAQNWRYLPTQYDVPSNPQVLGNMLCSAGLQGVVYPSARSAGTCLAVFPQNLDSHDSYVEVMPRVPRELEISRLDWTTWRELLEE